MSEWRAYKTNKRPFASSPAVLERGLVPFSPRAPRNLLQMRAHCPDGPRFLLVFPPMPVLRRADALSEPFLVATRVKQEDSADLAKQAGPKGGGQDARSNPATLPTAGVSSASRSSGSVCKVKTLRPCWGPTAMR